MVGEGTVRVRLLHDGVAPSPSGEATTFGLQDTKEGLHRGAPVGGGKLRFDFDLMVKAGPNPDAPVFTGPFASGTRDERFVYLSWKHTHGSGYMNRIKARLKDITWALVRQAQAAGRPLEADLTGRKAGGGTTPIAWRLGGD